MGFTLVATREGWLSLFMASVMIPGLQLVPILCVLMLPAWLLLAARPLMIIQKKPAAEAEPADPVVERQEP